MQLYFCYRLWVISQRLWWPVVPVVALLLASLGGVVYGVRECLLRWYVRIHSLMVVNTRRQSSINHGPVVRLTMHVSDSISLLWVRLMKLSQLRST